MDPYLTPASQRLHQGATRAEAEGLPARAAWAGSDDPVLPIEYEMLGKIVVLQLNRIRRRGEVRYGLPFENMATRWSSSWCRAVPGMNRVGG